ncbi:MAG: site-specific integrase, partial [Polyangiaceae bacterium]
FRRDDLEAILGEASVEQRLAFALAAYAGLRAGEVRGLRWPDVDLTGNTITVRRAMTRGEESTPKSGHQRRVPFAEPLRGLLLHAQSVRSGPWATVALTGHGKPWRDFGLNQAFKRVQERARRSGWSFHDLRHYCATELFRLGVGAPTVQRILGHAELSTTQRYADMTERDLRAAVTLLGNGLATSETEVAKAATPTTEK